jgi:hypothetical protein
MADPKETMTMFDKLTRFPLAAAPLVLGLGAAGFALASGESGAASDPVRCEIHANAAGGMIALEGVLHTDKALDGSYMFKVTSSGGAGRSNIQQGGYFSVGPDAPTTLGTVMLGNSGGTYDASLEIMANGTTVACADKVGGAI